VTSAALSTMWMQHRFDHVRPFAEAARLLGFSAIELSHYVTPDMMTGLRPGQVPVSSVHYPAPTILHSTGVKADKLLASPDDTARRWAVKQGFRSIELAESVGAKVICLHLGQVTVETHLSWALEQRYLAGQAGTAAYEALRAKVVQQREERASIHMDAAQRSLAELVERACHAGVRLGLENRRYPFEIPTPAELGLLLREHDQSAVGLWYDTGHAQVLANLGFHGPDDWLAAFADRIVGVHLHDCVGQRDHLVPHMGEIDFGTLALRCPADAVRVCEFDWFFDADEVTEGHRRLQRVAFPKSAFD